MMMIKPSLALLRVFLVLLVFGFFSTSAMAPDSDALDKEPGHKLQNPMTVEYLEGNLRRRSPRIIMTSEIRADLKKKVKSDPVVANYYKAMKINADEIIQKPFLERKQIGRRLLSVSREMLHRAGILSMIYSLENDKAILDRLNGELLAVCAFSDWNPSHFLDVAEMSLAVALVVDWVGKDLPKATIKAAKRALIDKGINPSYNKKGNVGWIKGSNNWNQVCHAGMIAAAIAVADDEPELAARTISRALDGMPYALDSYGPDGVYPEGATYWVYGTSFSVVASSMLQSAFSTDFGLAEYPAFLESADFKLLNRAPSGQYYNYGDCGNGDPTIGDNILAWFATYTGNETYLEKDLFLRDAKGMGKLSRLAGPSLVWMSQFEAKVHTELPLNWKGEGKNPIVIFRGGDEDPRQYYFAGKAGRGTVSHGNMDAGSFIFELDGVRWVIDPGNQAYHELEKTGFNLWNSCQDCERWSLLTKSNFGHSTLTVNDERHKVDGMATISDFRDGENPYVTLDLDRTFEGFLKSAKRTFRKDSPLSIEIIDELELDANTQLVTWQLMTTAHVRAFAGGAELTKDGKKLRLEILSNSTITPSIIALDPPPLELDKRIENLKRIEIRCPAYLFNAGKAEIRVRLTGV